MNKELEFLIDLHESCVERQLASMKIAVEELIKNNPDVKVEQNFDDWWSVGMIRYSLNQTKENLLSLDKEPTWPR